MLCVIHTFAGMTAGAAAHEVTVPLPDGPWRMAKSFHLAPGAALTAGGLVLPQVAPFTGQAVILERAGMLPDAS
jgi:hypothetical protein